MLTALANGEPLAQETGACGAIATGVARRWLSQVIGVFKHVTVAVDADLHNEKEISETLRQGGIDSRPLTLAERLAQLYLLRGCDFVKDLKGAFAVALWDEREQRLLLGVDRFGFKALYWCKDRESLLFASRASAVQAVRQQAIAVNPYSIIQYMLFSVIPAPLSIFEGVRRLLPGTRLVCERHETREEHYWNMTYVEDSTHTDADWARQVREGIRSAVHRSLGGCDPETTGAYLSGGTDSSSVVAFLSERIPSVHTFSIYFAESRYSEIGYARIAAERFQARYHELCLNPDDAVQAISKVVAFYDEPFGNSSAIGSYYCARLARETGMDMLLAGDGGDELFAGNERYASDKQFSLYHTLPAWLREHAIEPIVRLLPANDGLLSLPARYIRRASLPNPLRTFSYGVFLSSPAEDFFAPQVLQVAPRDEWLSIANGHFNDVRASSDLNRMMHLDLKLILADNDLRKVSGTAEMSGVRVRYPMLHEELVELSGRIPSKLKLKGFKKRYIFKQAMRGILPEEIIRKKKHGFGVPLGIWLLRVPRLKQLVSDVLGDSRTRQRGYFQPDFYDRLLRLHETDHASYYGEVVWYLLALELWHRQHVDGQRK